VSFPIQFEHFAVTSAQIVSKELPADSGRLVPVVFPMFRAETL